MAKRLFLLLFSGLFGIIIAPDFLTAADEVHPISPEFNAVLTEEIIEEPEPVYEELVYQAPVYEAPEPVYVAPSNSISIAGRKLDIVDVDSTAVDAGNHVNKYGEKFLYGHNSYNVFGALVNLGVGNTFSMYYGDVNYNYRISNIVIYEKDVAAGKLRLNGEGSYMYAVANARHDGVQYDLSIMTCHGTSYGNGDASHRLVIFANAI